MKAPLDTDLGSFGDRFAGVALGLGMIEPGVQGISARRRRRMRLAGEGAGAADSLRVLSMYEHDGVLRWEEGIGVPLPSSRRRRRGVAPRPDGRLVTQFSFAELPPNKIGEYLTSADARLTPSQGLFSFDAPGGDVGRATWKPMPGPAPNKRTLLFVHGTFSSIENLLGELVDAQNAAGRAFLADALNDYDQVLAFGHPTLTVSPFLNAVDLHRLFAGVRAEVHVVSHSRGGLVTRWWLDGLGGGAVGPRRAVLVACPMSGTGLASPARIRATMDLLTNVARGLELAGHLGATAVPFMSVASVLGRVLQSVTGTLANTPLADAAIAMVPGLAGQSRVGNNFELRRLRSALTSKTTSYFTISSNFEPADPGWKFWQYFRPGRALDVAADVVFDGENDLVVDTASMDQLADAAQQPVTASHRFGTNPAVHHCNYFRQPQTIAKLREWFG